MDSILVEFWILYTEVQRTLGIEYRARSTVLYSVEGEDGCGVFSGVLMARRPYSAVSAQHVTRIDYTPERSVYRKILRILRT